ncbi:large ribosomal subunit protein uL1-like [Dermacentor andersoni]|uniref:large ribosomal subunit protein uL1-like n=1 Tax=Dermacentor andersoni TaxID=34620 RepID=UPI0024162D42|nr:60S ribosomal protein L10a-2-like [Dermacentor andersoni]
MSVYVAEASQEEPTSRATSPQPEREPPTPSYSIFLRRVSKQEVYQCVNDVLSAAAKRRRRFLETVDLLVWLKDYNFQRYKRLNGIIRLPHVVKPHFRGCMIGYKIDRKEARACNLDFMSIEEVMLLKGRPTAIKKLAARYDAFLADVTLTNLLNKLLAQNFTKQRKCITPVPQHVPLDMKVKELRTSTRLWVRREQAFGISVGHVKMSADELTENVMTTVTRVLEKLKKGWEHVDALSIKSSMGPPCKLY